MQEILSRLRWFFTGLRLVLPLVPQFIWIAFRNLVESIIAYWKESQNVVEQLADNYETEVMARGIQTEYDSFVFWLCFSMASFLYLAAWLIQAWLAVTALQQLLSVVF